MAREIAAILGWRATLTVVSEMHIGADTLTGEAAPAFRDAADRLVVPGTTWAGVLRTLAHGENLDLWGTAEGTGGASRVAVADSVVDLAGRVPRRRDGVSVDRASGSALDSGVYAREVVPVGASLDLAVTVHSTAGSERDDLAFLAELTAAIESGRLVVGARTRRGLGRTAFAPGTGPRVTRRRYDSAAGYWRTRRTPEPVTDLPTAPPVADEGTTEIDIHWRPDTPVIVGESRSTTVPLAPIMVPAGDGTVRQLIPGTSIAGALRARAELVCRTVLGVSTPEGFTAQQASAPPSRWLFGGPAGDGDARPSALWVDDCHSTTRVPVRGWLSLLGATAPRTVTAGDAEIRVTDHVAVDRWTGGAADGRLFRVAEPHGFEYEPIRLRFDSSRLPEERRPVALALLMISIGEMAAGRVPLGAGTHRGLGHIVVSEVCVRVDGAEQPFDLRAPWFVPFRDAWRSWATDATAEVPA